MKKTLRNVVIALGVLLALVLIGPFLVPVPPPEGTVPPEELAGPGSHFVEVGELIVHYERAGEGEPALILLHGFGASTFSWHKVITPLAEVGTVVAFDRPAFGLTERPLPGEWEGESPYSPAAQVALTVGLMDELGLEKAVLVGNSAGGTVAVQTAQAHPNRIAALVLVDPAIYTGGGAGAPGWVLRSPQLRHVGPLLVRSIATRGEELIDRAWHDPALITEATREGYRLPLQARHWDRALWELTRARAGAPDPAENLDALRLPVLVITGDDDRIVPTEESIRLAAELPNADLVVIPDCGHVPQEECPGAFLRAVEIFLEEEGVRF